MSISASSQMSVASSLAARTFAKQRATLRHEFLPELTDEEHRRVGWYRMLKAEDDLGNHDTDHTEGRGLFE